MNTPANTKEIEQFRKDAKLLLSQYRQVEISEKLAMDNGNFSNYYNGNKFPSRNFLKKFNETFGEEIKELITKISHTDSRYPLSPLQEPKQDHPNPDFRDDHILTLKNHTQKLQEIINNYHTVLETNLSIILKTVQSIHDRQHADGKFMRQSLTLLLGKPLSEEDEATP